jgi:hypothetical protein
MKAFLTNHLGHSGNSSWQRLVNVAILSAIFVSSIFAQEILTNGNVVEMVKTGLSPEIIIAKIHSSSANFDTSTAALKLLTDAGVPDNVVIAMLTEAGKASKASAETAQQNNKLLSNVPEQGKLRDILTKSRIYLNTEDLKARDVIEKELKRIKKFVLVDRVEESDFIISYESWIESLGVTATVYGNTATARERTQIVGLLKVTMPSDDPKLDRLRLIYSARKTKYFVWEDNPAESTTKQFLKDLTRAAALAGNP